MKLLILGIDALPPDILFKYIDEFPNLKRLCETGSYGDYDAYAYGYGSRDNWISLYTGLTPGQHGVVGNIYKDTGQKPTRKVYQNQKPFWKVLNENGIKVGMWNGLVTSPAEKINGYMISGEANYELDWVKDPLAEVNPVFCKDDEQLERYIIGKLNRPPMPPTPAVFGYTWDYLFENNDLASEILTDDYFSACVDYLKEELNFYLKNIVNMQQVNPVDVLFFYDAIVDFIGHFQLHDSEAKEMRRALSYIDSFVGELLTELKPSNIIVMSDHGIKALADFLPDTPEEVQREAFGWRDRSIWLNNGQIVTKARNQGFMSAIHALKGTFIIAGQDIKKGSIKEMRTIDFYPTLLEMFNIEVPQDRKGYVLNVFIDRDIANKNSLLKEEKIVRKKIAILQTMEVPEFNRIINEVFLDYRFAEITIFAENKYKNIFMGNLRVNHVRELKDYEVNRSVLEEYEMVFIPYCNKMTGELKYIKLY